jgi:serine/threonine-protein kinase
MSPEQVRSGAPLSAASDRWAIGVLAYEALTAKIPFGGASAAETMVRISERGFTPPSRVRSELPPALDGWFARALAKDPDERFASGREAAEAFAAAATARTTRPFRSLRSTMSPAISIVAKPAQQSARGGWLLGGIAAACLVLATLFATNRGHDRAPVARAGLASAAFGAASVVRATISGATDPLRGPSTAPASIVAPLPAAPPADATTDANGPRRDEQQIPRSRARRADPSAVF